MKLGVATQSLEDGGRQAHSSVVLDARRSQRSSGRPVYLHALCSGITSHRQLVVLINSRRYRQLAFGGWNWRAFSFLSSSGLFLYSPKPLFF